MDKAWLDQKRAELKSQQEQHVGAFNQCAGALKMLDAVEAELAKTDGKKKQK